MTFREWRLINDKFDTKRSKIMREKMVQKALDSGRKGFRSVGDMKPFFSSGMIQQLLAWDSSLEKQFELPIILLCGYTQDKLEQLDYSAIAVMQQCHGRTIGVTTKKR
jgi:MEDS: MEthanogen/methylotroph, DcmR Sensory domain